MAFCKVRAGSTTLNYDNDEPALVVGWFLSLFVDPVDIFHVFAGGFTPLFAQFRSGRRVF